MGRKRLSFPVRRPVRPQSAPPRRSGLGFGWGFRGYGLGVWGFRGLGVRVWGFTSPVLCGFGGFFYASSFGSCSSGVLSTFEILLFARSLQEFYIKDSPMESFPVKAPTSEGPKP